MKPYKKIFKEANLSNNDKKKILGYAQEIYNKFMTEPDQRKKLINLEDRKVFWLIIRFICDLTAGKYKQYLPSNWDKKLMSGEEGGNLYDSGWWQLHDDQKFNIIKHIKR